MVGETRDDLRRLVNYKEHFIVRRQAETGKKKKLRDLAYPSGRLRSVHERLKFHLNKIKQPDYLFSPRKGKSQRDNAAAHIGQCQYLTLDLKQFYPSTNSRMVKRWFENVLRMEEDVAGLLTHIATVDGKVSFGSPLTPVLCSLVHRPMFDKISELCHHRGLNYTVWVDDLTISGRFVPQKMLSKIRKIIQEHGLRSHDIRFRTGNRPVFITGIGVLGRELVAPRALHLSIRASFEEYHDAVTDVERDAVEQKLLSQLGTLRHVTGAGSKAGQKAADQMHSLRQKRDKRQRLVQEALVQKAKLRSQRVPIAQGPAPF
ncbi:reverse transcriptase family protein [Sphingobium sp.]|uniref:reverse transcriptase family protein n=1 Tax=Sphingobium sp. TaxID=1912891 RepID=UPI002C517B54|nr:reverse transcriptase family protein [Sphingobium sp.]HUD91610.1 reverse transcriptase family protein [Sphingobium sp.]